MKSHDFIISSVDTDAICVNRPGGASFSKAEQEMLLGELNDLFPKFIKFSKDGYFKRLVALKAKNYITMSEDGKIKIKGSALKSSKTEKALKEFLDKLIHCFLFDKQHEILSIYQSYVKEAFNVTDITRWSKKITITDKVLHPKRTNELKVLNAVKHLNNQQGNKVYLYFKLDDSLGLQEDWRSASADHCPHTLLEKIYKTLSIFSTVIDITQFPKYQLKKNRYELAQLLGRELVKK